MGDKNNKGLGNPQPPPASSLEEKKAFEDAVRPLLEEKKAFEDAMSPLLEKVCQPLPASFLEKILPPKELQQLQQAISSTTRWAQELGAKLQAFNPYFTETGKDLRYLEENLGKEETWRLIDEAEPRLGYSFDKAVHALRLLSESGVPIACHKRIILEVLGTDADREALREEDRRAGVGTFLELVNAVGKDYLKVRPTEAQEKPQEPLWGLQEKQYSDLRSVLRLLEKGCKKEGFLGDRGEELMTHEGDKYYWHGSIRLLAFTWCTIYEELFKEQHRQTNRYDWQLLGRAFPDLSEKQKRNATGYINKTKGEATSEKERILLPILLGICKITIGRKSR